MKKNIILYLVLILSITSNLINTKDKDCGCKKNSNIGRSIETNNNKPYKLYSYKNCPYCVKVKDFLKKNQLLGKDSLFDLISAEQNEHYNDLQKLSGSTQCPFLYDTKRKKGIIDSSKIIEYIQNLINKNEL